MHDVLRRPTVGLYFSTCKPTFVDFAFVKVYH